MEKSPKDKKWVNAMAKISNWSDWLAEGDEPEKLEVLRRNVHKGLPCGSERFKERLSKISGRNLKFIPRGRPREKLGEDKG